MKDKILNCILKCISIGLNIYNLYLVFIILHSYLSVFLYFAFNYMLKLCIIANYLKKSGALSDISKLSDTNLLSKDIEKSIENTRSHCIIFDLLIFIGLNCFILNLIY